MAIRCAAKALIVRDGWLLLNRCRRSDGAVYYDLPGGGQNPFESMEEFSEFIDTADISEEDREKICWKNAEALFL